MKDERERERGGQGGGGRRRRGRRRRRRRFSSKLESDENDSFNVKKRGGKFSF